MNKKKSLSQFFIVNILVWIGLVLIMILAAGWFGTGRSLLSLAAFVGLAFTVVSLVDLLATCADTRVGERRIPPPE